MADRKMLQARESFAIYLADGTPFAVVAGDRFWSDDPAVIGRENLFGEVTVRTSLPVAPRSTSSDTETASAAPGTRRPMTRPAARKDAGGKTDA